MRRFGLWFALAALGLTACGGPAPGASVTAAAEKVKEAGSAKMDMRMLVESPSGSFDMNAVGAFEFTDAPRGHMSMTMTPGGGFQSSGMPSTIEFELVYDGFVIYMRVPQFQQALPEGKEWVKLDLQAQGEKMGFDFSQLLQAGQSNPTQGLDYLKGVKDVEEAGSEEVRGVSTTHYRGTVDFEAVKSELPADQHAGLDMLLDQLGSTEIPIDVWIDDEGLVRRMQQKFTIDQPNIGEMTMDMTMELYDFGTNVEVQVPDPSEVADIPGT